MAKTKKRVWKDIEPVQETTTSKKYKVIKKEEPEIPKESTEPEAPLSLQTAVPISDLSALFSIAKPLIFESSTSGKFHSYEIDFENYADSIGIDNPEEMEYTIVNNELQKNPLTKFQYQQLKEKYIGRKLFYEIGYETFKEYLTECTSGYWNNRIQRLRACDAADRKCFASCPYYYTKEKCPTDNSLN